MKTTHQPESDLVLASSSKQEKVSGRTDSGNGSSEEITEHPASQIIPETDLSNGIIGWDSQSDPNNPQNFTAIKKWVLLVFISAFTFISPLASNMSSPGVVYVAEDFHETNKTILSFSVSIFLLG